MIKLILALTSLSLCSFAQQAELERQRLFKTPDPASLGPGAINENKEVFLYNESLLDEEKGGYSETFYTGTDRNRFSLGYHFSVNYQDFSELSSLEILFSRELKTFTETWISLLLKRTVGKYEALAEEIESSNNTVIRNGTDQSFTTVGFGVGYRFKALARSLESSRFFETVDAYLTYNSHIDGADSEQYQGFGLQTDYGLHYRSAESFFYGGKLSYNISSLARSAKDDEKLDDRSLVFGWLSLGFEMGYYY